MLITGFGVADGVPIGTADGCDEGGGPDGTADAFACSKTGLLISQPFVALITSESAQS